MFKSSLYFLRPLHFLLEAALLFFVTGCSSADRFRDTYIVLYQSGNATEAEAMITSEIDKTMPGGDFKKNKDAVWLLLDRATAHFVEGQTEEACRDYKLALEAIDFYSQTSANEQVGKYFFQDEVVAYSGDDFERVLVRIYFALALIHKGDMGNAYALLRQAEELQQKIRDGYRSSKITEEFNLVDNGLGKLLFATLLQKRGDKSNAEILFGDAKDLVGPLPFERAFYDTTEGHKDAATVLVVCHNGNAPYKISMVTDASLASAVALELFLQGMGAQPALSSLPGVQVPALEIPPESYPLPTYVAFDGGTVSLVPWFDVNETAQEQLDQNLPVIVARAVARLLIRRGMTAAIQEQNCDARALFDVAMFIANIATKADTRSWNTLPCRFDVASLSLAPGTHDIDIIVAPNAPFHRTKRVRVTLDPRDLCVINVFNIHPGVTSILIPEKFCKAQE